MIDEDEDEEDDDYNVELMASDLEQMQSLLEFKVKAHRHSYSTTTAWVIQL